MESEAVTRNEGNKIEMVNFTMSITYFLGVFYRRRCKRQRNSEFKFC